MLDPEITTVYSVHGFDGEVLVHKSILLIRDDLPEYCVDMADITGKQDIIVKIFDMGLGIYVEIDDLLK